MLQNRVLDHQVQACTEAGPLRSCPACGKREAYIFQRGQGQEQDLTQRNH